MSRRQQPEAAEPGQRVRREHQDEAERQHQLGHSDRQERHQSSGNPQAAAGAGLNGIGQWQADDDIERTGDGDDLQAGAKRPAEARIARNLDEPPDGEATRQQRVLQLSPNDPSPSSNTGAPRKIR
jgi:hypothetical protein